MWWDVPPEMRGEWEHWHSNEHMPERLAVPGFLRGSRWVSGNSYFVLYEASSIGVLTGGAYLERLNNPTPWSRKMMPHHRNMVRSLCRIRARFGHGIGQVLATIRSDVAQHALSPLAQRKGITSACLLESQAMTGMPPTTEQKIRGGDAEAGWVALIGGYDADAVAVAAREVAPQATASLYRLSYLLTA